MDKKQAKPVLISFARLGDLLDRQGKKWIYLREQGISPGIVGKLRHGSGHIDTRTIQDVCEIMHCQPGDIMEYVQPEESETTRTTRGPE